MLMRLLLLMTIVPAVELYLLMQLAEAMGIFETVLLILVTGSVGATLAKREGLGVLTSLQADLKKGLPPADRLVEGLLVLVGGTLLITPGVLTDLAGFSLIFPVTRRWLAPRVKNWGAKRFKFTTLGAGVPPSGGGVPAPEASSPESDFSRPDKPPPTVFEHPER